MRPISRSKQRGRVHYSSGHQKEARVNSDGDSKSESKFLLRQQFFHYTGPWRIDAINTSLDAAGGPSTRPGKLEPGQHAADGSASDRRRAAMHHCIAPHLGSLLCIVIGDYQKFLCAGTHGMLSAPCNLYRPCQGGATILRPRDHFEAGPLLCRPVYQPKSSKH